MREGLRGHHPPPKHPRNFLNPPGRVKTTDPALGDFAFDALFNQQVLMALSRNLRQMGYRENLALPTQ